MNASPADPVAPGERHSRTILVVEDKVELRYTLAAWLRMQDYVVLEAATADEAAVMLQSPLAIDLVVTDVHMPGSMNGLTLAGYINSAFPDVKVIIVSGELEQREIKGQWPFFRKPYRLEDVTHAIEKLLAGGRA